MYVQSSKVLTGEPQSCVTLCVLWRTRRLVNALTQTRLFDIANGEDYIPSSGIPYLHTMLDIYIFIIILTTFYHTRINLIAVSPPFDRRNIDRFRIVYVNNFYRRIYAIIRSINV